MKKLVSIIILCLACLGGLEAQNYWKPIGMQGIFLGAGPDGSLYCYGSSEHGIAITRSQDEGETWQVVLGYETGFNCNFNWNCFSVSPEGRIFLFEGYPYRAFFSDDNGDSWQLTSGAAPLTAGDEAQRICAVNNDTLVGSASSHFVFWTTDGGATWDTIRQAFIEDDQYIGNILANGNGDVFFSLNLNDGGDSGQNIGVYHATLSDMDNWELVAFQGVSINDMEFDPEGNVVCNALVGDNFDGFEHVPGFYAFGSYNTFGISDNGIVYKSNVTENNTAVLAYSMDHGETFTEIGEELELYPPVPGSSDGFLCKGYDNFLYFKCRGLYWKSIFSANIIPNKFAPQGAEWYFNVSSFMGSPISYYHMEVLGDTIIQGHTCSVITQQFYGGNGQEQYVYEDNRKVYWYNQTLGRFTTLYDFDAEVGESWICEVDSCSFEIQVQSVEEETWEGHTYRVQHVYAIGEDEYNSFFYTGEGTIIEGIGEISGLFPYSGACNGSIYDGQHLNYLRCYLVDGEMLYHQGSYDCDEYGYCWDGTVAESYGGGDGTEENPYKIYTSNQLALLAQQTNNGTGGDAYYKIMDNINLANCDGGIQQWISIGTPEHPFTGHFDGWGNAKTILNLHQTISDGDAQPVGGLFGCTNGAEINNVNLVQCYVHGSAQYAGTLVGYAGLTNISDCSIYDGCAETDNGVAGGLVGFAGYTYGENGTSEETYTIVNCVVREAVKVRSSECAGGVVGLVGDLYANTPYDIIGCSMEGTADYFYVQGSMTAGGVVGHIWSGMVRGCTNHQKVIGGDNPGGGWVGGVVGMLDYSEVSDCINYGQVSSAEDVAIVNVGGIVGGSRGFENDSGGNILNCQNYGDVTGTLCCGGIIGSLFSSKPSFVQNCHNHGQVTCNAPWSAGGIVGGSSGAIRVCYIIECSNFGDVVVNHQDEGDAGGILGSVKDIDQEIYILNAFNRGTVSAPQYAGGILGGTMDTRNCTIQNVYNTGEVISGEEIKGAIAFNQQENDHFSDCYWLGLLDNHAGISEGEPLQHSCAFWPTTYYGEWTLDSLQFGHDLVEALNAGVELIENLYPEVGPLNRWGYDVEEINDGFPILVPTNIGDDELEAYCEAPMYFGGSPISDQGTYGAQLWWNKPFASHWFHYDDKPYEGSVYCNYWGIRIPAEEIQSGDVLTHVAFYRAGGQDQTMHYVFAFGFEGETEPDSWDYLPGNSVQVEPGPDEWVMVKLGNPIACEEGKCLWIVLEAPNVEGNNAPYCQTSGNPNACWSSEGNAAGDWMIRGYFINDVGYNDPGYNETLDHYNIYHGSSLEEMEKVAEVGRDDEEYFDTLQQPFGDYYYQLTASYTDGRESMPAKRGDNPQSLDYVYFHVGNISSLGSEWYYEIQNENGSITYQHLQYAADTTINHKDVKIIIRTNTLYDKGEHSEVTREYIYEDFGKVYWWNESIQDFTLLYNLGAQVGDEWVIEVGEESIIMHVDAVEQYEYDGTTYRMLHVSDANNLFSGEIMSGVGHLTSFFPERLMTRDKGYRVTGLRCYWIYGDLVFTVDRGDCDAIYAELHYGLDEPTAIPFAIYPNPTDGVLTIHHSAFSIQHSTFRITNLMGQTLQTGSLTAETQQIDVSGLPQGMYFITVGDMTQKFVVR